MNSQSVQEPVTQIAFVFDNVAHYQELVAAFLPDVEVHVLDASKDGLQQMSAILAGRSGIDGLHVVGHGAQGTLNFGSVTLDSANIGGYTDVLSKIGAALADDGDILLYGCDVGAAAIGARFVGQIAQATGADVAASTDATGGAQRGGDWVLEYRQGEVTSDGALDAAAVHSLDSLLGLMPTGLQDVTPSMTTSSFVGGFTLSVQSGYSLTGAYDANGLYFDSPAPPGEWRDAKFIVTADNTNITAFDLDGLNWVKYSTTGTFSILVTGFDAVGLQIAQTTVSTTNGSSSYTGGDFSTFKGIHSFTVEIIGSSDPLVHWPISQNTFDGFTVSSPIAANIAPTFIDTTTQLTATENTAVDVAALLHVSDSDGAQTLTWSQNTAPSHGTLTFTGATASSGSTNVTPGGSITYTPASGYAGTDSFVVKVSDGTATATRTVTVTVKPPAPGAPVLTAATDTGLSTSDKITKATSVAFSGTGPSGDSTSTVQVWVDKNGNGLYDAGTDPISTAATLSGGSWTSTSIDVSGLANGSYNVYGQISGGGQVGPTSSAGSFTVDRTAPTVTISSNVSKVLVGQTATITFTFSEDPGSSFTWNGTTGDVVVTGGTLSAISGSGTTRTATFTPAPGLNSTAAGISIASGSYTDAAGNNGGAGTTPSLTIDTLAPTVTIISDKSALKIGETATITFTFSDDPGAAFDASDVTVTGGTLGALSGTGTTRSAVFTPTASTNGGTASITVAAGAYADAAGNASGGGTTPSLTFDTLAPTLAITSDKAALKTGETATITFTFSEDPGASFDASDVTVTGGTLGTVSGTGATRTATFTPSANTNAGAASIAVAGGTYTDAAGNNGGAGTTPSITFDTLAPTVTITSDKSALKVGETATITFTFSEDPGASFAWNGTSGDVVVSGGTLSAISGSGSTRTATFTPTANTNGGTASITIASGSYNDTAGNAGGAGATPGVSFDTLAPTVTISSDKSALKIGETATITFTFSEDPGAAFDASDLTVSGGTLGALSGTGTTRSAVFTPTPSTNGGTASITVAAGAYADAAGNDSGAGATPSLTFDTLAPTLAITSDKAALKVGETATITFTFSEDPGVTFDASDVTVTGGTLGALSGTGTTRSAVFTPTANTNGGTASITVAGGTYTDAAGNDGGAGTTPSVSFDTLAPTVTITSDKAALKIGETATITFTFSEDPGGAFDSTDLTVTGGTLGALSGTGTTRSAVFTPTASTNGGTASITVAAGAYADAAGNASGAGATPSLTFDTLAPTLAITSDKAALKIGETATITFTFSEDPGATFDASDVTVTGGTLSALSGTGTTRSATFTPTANTNAGTASITVAGGSYADGAGNDGGAGATPSVSFDTLAPTLTITSDKSALVIGETATITFTFSEDPGATFDASDLTVTGGTLGALAGTGTTRTATFTPTANTNGGTASITVAGGTYTDAAGNGGGAGTTPSVSFDTLAPTVTITSDKAALKIGETATIIFTFSEDPGATFDASDLAVTGGTLSALSGTGTTRSAVFTPTASTNGGTASITVAGGSYTDGAGNNGGAGATPSVSFDTLAPTVTVTSDKPTLKAGETATITFTFSEDPGVAFDASDVTVTGGTLGALSGTGTTRSAVFTPTANTNAGTASITVAAGAYADAAGNDSGAGATPSLTFDTLVPTLAITSDKAALKIGETATITFTFSEDPGATFDASDVTVTGGTLGALSGTGTTRSAVFTPTANTNGGTASITVAGGAYTDAAGNDGGAGATPGVTFDTLAPTLAITSDKAALKIGETATITFAFSEDPGATFDASDLTVTGGTLGALSGTGTTRSAVFTPTANTNGGTASITVAGGTYTDAAGNDGGAGTTPSVSFDTLAPTVAITSDKAALKIGETATITFTFSEDPGATFDASDVTVSGGTLGALSGAGTTRSAVFTPDASTNGGTASITITSGTYTDTAGNAGGAGATPGVSFDTLAPTVTITSDKAALKIGETATITFTFSEDPGVAFDASDLTVSGGTLGALSGTGTTRSAVFTPTPSTNGGTASITVVAGAYADAAGNDSGAGATPSLTFDTLAPALAITSDKAALKVGETATITFTFSEDPGATFDATDITVTGGTLGALSGTGATRTATFTPTANTNGGTASITVAGGAYTDAAGNDGGAGAAPSVTFDTLAPTVAITSDKAALKIGETATITFTFSEDPGATFDAGDVTVSGGTLGALSGTGTTRSAVFTPTASTNGGTASITVAGGTYTDAAGNDGGAGTTPSVSFDTLAPTVTVTSDKSALKIGEAATITFTFSEDPGATFDASDLTVSGGTLGALSGTGTTRTATFTPTANTNAGTASITVAGGTYTDAAGNDGGAGATPSLTFDTLAPTLAITSDKAALKAGETATITFTFSEDPGATFDASDLTVSGGTLGTLSGTGTTRSAVFTPTASTNGGTASITVAGGTYTDAAGNDGGAGATPSLAFDTLAPTLAITSDKAALKIGETATITFTFSEDPGATFDASDVTVTGGTLGALSGTGTTRSAVFTPANGVNAGTASISVAGGTYTDGAGNNGGAGATPSVSFDTLAPTLAITSDKAALKIGETATITFTFSEDPGATFDASDLTVSGGTLGPLSGTGATRTATFTPTASTNGGTASITVAGGAYTDAAGNDGGAGATPSVTFDTLAPTLSITSDKAALKAGETATVTFTFSEDPGATFDASDVAVTGGTLGALSGTGTMRTATFTPTTNTNAGTASITVAGGTYTDAAGNNGGAGATPSVSFDTLAPTVAITSDKAALKIGETATISFTFSEDPGATFDASDVTVTGGTLGALSGTGTTRSAVFTPTASTNGGTASITIASGTYTDTAGNAGAAGATPSVSFDTLAPTLAITSDKSALKVGETATITFTFSEDPGATFDASDVTVSGGTLGALSGTGTTRSAVFTPTASTNGGTASITVAGGTYTDGAGNNGGAGATPSVTFDTLAPTLAISSDKAALKIGETATITFTFSEDPGATFDASDVAVSGGTLGTLSGTGTTRTAVFTPANGVNAGTASISVAGGAYTDAAGNNGGAGATPSVTFDTLAPTLAITSDKAALKAGETATITFTFSEDPGATFDASDLTVTGGVLSTLSGTGATRIATFTPTANTNGGTASITVAGGTYTDSAGNNGGAGATPGLSFDTLAPTLAITSDKPALKAGETATVTFTFSEDPGATFDASDVTVSGGTLGAWSGTGATRTATFTPTTNTNAGTASITVAGGTYTDGAGNNGGAGATPSVTFDTLAPTLAITSNKSALKIGETATITFTFSEDPGATFDASDLTVTGGVLSTLSGTGTTRTATFTPAANTNAGTASITVAAGTYTDGAGNGGGAGTTPGVTFDTLAPTVTITSDKAALKVGETATITFTFSEDPGATFDASDLTVSGGTLSTLSGTGATRSAVFTPTASTNGGTASITVAGGAYTDGAGNNGGAGATPSLSFDTLAPTLAITSDKAALKIGEAATITFTFSEDPGATFDASDVTVSGGTLGALSGTGTTRTATFTPTASTNGGTASITVAGGTYTDGAGNNGGAGATSVAFDTLAPTVTVTSDKAALKIGETATITFTFSEDPGATFDASDLTVTGGVLSTLSGTGTTRTAIFTPDANMNNTTANITVAAGAYADSAGNAGGAGVTPTLTFDTLAPAAPSVPVLDAASDSGVSNSDKLTNAAAPRFTGTAEDGATVNLIDPVTRAVLGTGVAAGGHWAIDVSALPDGIASIAAVATDAAGNTGAASAASSVTIDRTAPVALSLALASGMNGNVVSSGAVKVSGIEDGASWQYSLDGGAHWQVGSGSEFTVTAEGPASVLAHQTDRAGNTSAASNVLVFTLDTSGPTSSVSLSDLALTSGETATVTISFNERVVGLDLGDISVSNATLSNLATSDGGLTWTALMTPNPGVSSTTNVISVDNAGVTDAVGNRGIGASTSANYTVQTGKVAAAIELSDTSLLAGETAVVTIRFSEVVTGFTLADLSAESGKLSRLESVDNGRTWTALFTPATNIDDATNLIKVDNSGVIGAQGQRGEGTSSSANYTVNTIRPTASVTVDTKVLAPGAHVPVTIKFSQPVLGFDSADLTVSHATLSALASRDGGMTWTATLTADGGGSAAAPGWLSIDMGGVRNAAGNAGTGSISAHYVVAPAGSAIGTVDGVPVVSQTTTDPKTGREQQILMIPEVPAVRQDDPNSANQKLADIPLVSNPNAGSPPVLTASLPAGAGLQVEGPAAPLSKSDALTDLIQRIQDKTSSGSAAQTDMTSQGQDFLNSLGANGLVESRTIVPTLGTGASPGQPIVISGAATGSGPNAPVVGLVIDGAGLPAGSTLQLDNVDFAAVIGDVRLIGGQGKNYVVGDGGSQTIYLGPDDDVLSGGGGDDFIGSAGGDDHLDGGDGNDLVAGGIGNDTVIGGAGDDMLNGGRSTVGDWTFHMSAAGAISATHDKAVFTASGTETVQGGELDATVAELGFLKAAPQQLAGIAMLYAGLDRAPDVAGLTFWARAGVSLADVANGVLASAEFGGTALAHADNATFVRGMYLQVLGREPETAAMEYWSARLSGSDGRAPSNRADVLVAVALSDEHKGKMLAADGYTIAQSSLAQETAWFSGSGDDRLDGGTGHNLLVGGDGVDTAVYGGNQAQYHVLIGTDGLLRVADITSDSLDTLSGIEVAEFKDGKVDLTILGKDVGQLDRVGLMFQAVFHHAAGLDALKSFLALNADAPGMARALVATSEFQARFGAASDAAFVQALYANSGLDASKAGGMQSWQDYLGHHSRAELIATWIAQDDVQHAQFGNAGLWLF